MDSSNWKFLSRVRADHLMLDYRSILLLSVPLCRFLIELLGFAARDRTCLCSAKDFQDTKRAVTGKAVADSPVV